MLNATFTAWNNSFAAVESVSDIQWALSFEPLPPAIYNKAAPGTNALGLSGERNNLVVVLLSAGWTNESDDALMTETAQQLIASIESQAKQLGEYNEFLYFNYAAPWQKPVAGYGKTSLAELQRVSKAYDPSGVFQRRVPGGFKLF